MLLSSSVWRGNARWWLTAGLMAGGVASAVVAVTVGSLLRPLAPHVVTSLLLVVVFLLVAGKELGLLSIGLPQNARQVPQWIVEEGGRVGALQFGFEMGTGVRTFMTSGLPHLLAVAVLLAAGWREAMLAGLMFGSGRAWMTLSRLWHGDVDAWDAALSGSDRRLRALLVLAAAMALVPIVVQLPS